MTHSIAYVVVWEGKHYLYFKRTNTGQARLVSADGKVVPIAVPTSDLKVVKKLKATNINGVNYVNSKSGVFSLSTGRKIKQKSIVNKLVSSHK